MILLPDNPSVIQVQLTHIRAAVSHPLHLLCIPRRDPRKSKVSHLDTIIARDQKILAFKVSMNTLYHSQPWLPPQR
jgi:hypothetical protein